MKQRPIIFNTEMVRAILDGRKTQTRRPFPKWQQPFQHKDGSFGAVAQRDPHYGFGFTEDSEVKVMECFTERLCPIARVGDQLWVRETMTMEKWPDLHYVCGGLSVGTGDEDFSYRAEDYRGFIPSIHMPKWASRILLEVTHIRLERLEDISEEEAVKEGFDNSRTQAALSTGWYEKPRKAFLRTWEKIYNNVNDNPWVWVIDFEVITTTGGAA
jgi:hypothetical protein